MKAPVCNGIMPPGDSGIMRPGATFVDKWDLSYPFWFSVKAFLAALARGLHGRGTSEKVERGSEGGDCR